MSYTSEILVCVGGPHDGERRTVARSALYVEFTNLSDLPIMYGTEEIPSMDEVVSYTRYQRMRWQAPGHERFVLIPDGQTQGQTLDLLIDSYGGKSR